MDRYALTCSCTCHGRGPSAPCDPEYPAGCGADHVRQHTAATTCPGCHRPVADGALCRGCTTALRDDLAEVAGLSGELDTWRAKLDRIGSRAPRGGQNIPLGYRPAAVEVADVLHMTLAGWARDVAEHTGDPDIPTDPHAPALASWLADRLEAARHLTFAGVLADEVGYAVRTARRAIDRPADRTYAGPCDVELPDGARCDADLYAFPGADHVVCRACGARYLMAERRAWLLDGVREHLATAAEISAGVGELYGQPINRRTITTWHHRNRLPERGRTAQGYPLYRIGDVLDLAASSITRPVGGPRAKLTSAAGA
ncbi:hypothetical protein [Pseudonocardia sp. D17]|uniref:hypothetical protein n=1 Tax=Pseudonocardia sp. D17 TaxID=882661 RepID=UPI002B3D23A4|nr:hypothetical protein PSD17_56510 [Pseudonocardia sp. D17]